jgi:hypothetical protein
MDRLLLNSSMHFLKPNSFLPFSPSDFLSESYANPIERSTSNSKKQNLARKIRPKELELKIEERRHSSRRMSQKKVYKKENVAFEKV